MKTYRVVIADDHELVRTSLRRALEAHGEFVIAAEARDGLEAIAVTRANAPDLLLLDVSMPLATGVEVVEEVRRWSPATKIAVLTGMTSPQLFRHLHDSGVEGIFLKSRAWGSQALHMVEICRGGRYVDPDVADKAGNGTALTARERQVLFNIARGHSNAGIAEVMGISPSTVDKHRTSMMRKLGAHTAANLIAKAYQDGLLDSFDHS